MCVRGGVGSLLEPESRSSANPWQGSEISNKNALRSVCLCLSYLSGFPFFSSAPALVSSFSLQVDFLCSFNHMIQYGYHKALTFTCYSFSACTDLYRIPLSRERESNWPKLESDILTGPINSGKVGQGCYLVRHDWGGKGNVQREVSHRVGQTPQSFLF